MAMAMPRALSKGARRYPYSDLLVMVPGCMAPVAGQHYQSAPPPTASGAAHPLLQYVLFLVWRVVMGLVGRLKDAAVFALHDEFLNDLVEGGFLDGNRGLDCGCLPYDTCPASAFQTLLSCQ